MKRTVALCLCLVAAICVIRCKKNDAAPAKNLATCTTCSSALLQQTPDTVTGMYYYLPTAFTPNGDGINDVWGLVYNDHFIVDSSTITVWDLAGNGVYKGAISQKWNGHDLHGVLCPAAHYAVYLRLLTKTGAWIEQCGCVTLLTFKGTCIYTGGKTYSLPDELDTARGFTYPTNDHLCP